MEELRPRLALLISCAAVILSVACGQGNTPYSPTAPTETLGFGSPNAALAAGDVADAEATASNVDAFVALGGRGKGGDKDKGKGKDDDDSSESDDDERGDRGDHQGGNGRGDHGELSGFVTARGVDTLTVRGTVVLVSSTTVIRHGHRTLAMSDIEVGDHVQARGTMEGTTLVATEIKVEDTGNDNDDEDEAELKGAVAGLTGTCPVLTFTIGAPATTVKTNSSTKFEDVACAALANGAVVEVEGVTQTDGSILATKVEKEDGPDEVEGSVFELSGTCPALTFKVGHTAATATTVTTSTTTTFSGVTCVAIANGTKVEVEGTKQADGSIAATSVKLD